MDSRLRGNDMKKVPIVILSSHASLRVKCEESRSGVWIT